MLREDEGRKLVKARHLEVLARVYTALQKHQEVSRRTAWSPAWPFNGWSAEMDSRNLTWLHTLQQKVRYKRYVLTQMDMKCINLIYTHIEKGVTP